MYYNLQKVASSSFGRFQMAEGLKREFYHLRDIGYIEVESISSLPSEGSNLSAYVPVTDTGHRFVSLLGDLQGARRAVQHQDAAAGGEESARNS